MECWLHASEARMALFDYIECSITVSGYIRASTMPVRSAVPPERLLIHKTGARPPHPQAPRWLRRKTPG